MISWSNIMNKNIYKKWYKALSTVPLTARKQIYIHEQKYMKNLLIDKEKNKQKSPSAYFIIQWTLSHNGTPYIQFQL